MDICIENICKAYGKNKVLQNLYLELPGGRTSCILGPSGRGKTTLLRIIAGLEAPDSGRITGVEGKKISAVFQEDRLFENLSAEKNILLTARRGFTQTDAKSLLAELGIHENTDHALHSFSGGMKRRVAIARALAADYDLLLLDEPFSGLDDATRTKAIAAVHRHAKGRTAVCITHDAADAQPLEADIIRL